MGFNASIYSDERECVNYFNYISWESCQRLNPDFTAGADEGIFSVSREHIEKIIDEIGKIQCTINDVSNNEDVRDRLYIFEELNEILRQKPNTKLFIIEWDF